MKNGKGPENCKKKRWKLVCKSCNTENMIAECRYPEKKMRFVNIIAPVIDHVYIVTGQVHSQTYIGMVPGIIIHQRHKQPGNIYKAKQGIKKYISTI